MGITSIMLLCRCLAKVRARAQIICLERIGLDYSMEDVRTIQRVPSLPRLSPPATFSPTCRAVLGILSILVQCRASTCVIVARSAVLQGDVQADSRTPPRWEPNSAG